jgi:RNA polymerase sigma-70 factor (ECF subfamily)
VTETDIGLLERFHQDDPSAFEMLFMRHYERVYRVAYNLLGSRDAAEDLTQETFLALYHSPPRLRDHDGLAAWLCRVALNRGYNTLRGEQRERQRIEHMDLPPDPADPYIEVARAEERAHVRAVVARLPERQGKLLLLRYAGLSYAEIAAALDVSPASVGTLLARAERAFLKAYQASVAPLEELEEKEAS